MSELIKQCEVDQQNLYILERRHLDYTHAEVGGRLLERWKVPQSIYEPVQYHHRPGEADEFVQMASAVQIADVWVNKHQVGTSGEKATPTIDPEATQLLGIEDYELDEIWMLALDEIIGVFCQVDCALRRTATI